MQAEYIEEIGEWVISTPDLGEFFGATPHQAERAYLDALRVAADHARKNNPLTAWEQAQCAEYDAHAAHISDMRADL